MDKWGGEGKHDRHRTKEIDMQKGGDWQKWREQGEAPGERDGIDGQGRGQIWSHLLRSQIIDELTVPHSDSVCMSKYERKFSTDNSISETKENFDLCNSWKRLGPRR